MMSPRMAEMHQDKQLWVPDWLEGPADPPEPRSAPSDRHVHVNLVPGEVEIADDVDFLAELDQWGRITEEPEIGRARSLSMIPEEMKDSTIIETPSLLQDLVEAEMRVGGYSDTYWTHFDYREDVKRMVVRTQKRFPYRTYMCTYYRHPPVYGRKYEFVSNDVWQGGLRDGKYVGYRGKPLNPRLGAKVFNALFYDEYGPPIYWIIYRGRMWTRGYGWGPAPGGPAGSDPGHWEHIHDTRLLIY